MTKTYLVSFAMDKKRPGEPGALPSSLCSLVTGSLSSDGQQHRRSKVTRTITGPACLRFVLSLLIFCGSVLNASFSFGQDSDSKGAGHLGHHPGQGGPPDGDGPQNAGPAGKGGGMMGGKGGGMMDGMMKKMGAPKPKEMYSKLMDLPDLPLEERVQIEQEAHQRMLEGTALLSEGLDELSIAASNDDFASMQIATAKMREGLSRFESGLAANRALAEGKSPRNVALTWFKREMNLLPPAAAPPGFHFFGMTLFHTLIMLLLVLFAAIMIWMYFFKMRRAAALLEKLTAAKLGATVASDTSVTADPPGDSKPSTPQNALSVATVSSPEATSTSAVADCCAESAVDCESESETSDRPDISQGLLRVAKRKLCRLRVARIYQETDDVKTFRLVACHGGSLPFSYLPGQFLTATLPVGEKKIRRSYTISSSPTQGYYCEITVKREDQGVGSRYLHDNIEEGNTLEVQAPSGKFIFTGKEDDSVVLIAGGVGITPMMSMTRALTDMGWSGQIYFIVACRTPDQFIYQEELKTLQHRHSNLHMHVAMSRIEKEVGGYHAGRLSKEMFAGWVPDIASKWINLCGAPQMMDSTKVMLAELGVPKENIHFENFGSQKKTRKKSAPPKEIAKVAANKTTEAAASVNFSTSEKTTPFLLDETILEAAERVEIDIDNSCRTGMCGVCVVKLLSGQVAMETEDGLEDDEKAAGMILACQAKSTGDVTVEA
ncbi:MAG: 2Fe-2S iron-sulfur cluster binding domain-containing protein [Planctomycetaceae bacterium]|nr:2Fe-2S iron-sulfur cluster binding domain-containing protein [Planctomycetaceae bacterium]